MSNETKVLEDYFQFSQAVKKEIENNQCMVSNLIGHFGNIKPLTGIGREIYHAIYRVGQLESGLWVALRKNIEVENLFEEHTCFNFLGIYIYEDYCLNAESRAQMNEVVPRFCIGGSYKGKPFLLTEDMEEGGKCPLRYESKGVDLINVREKEGVKERISFDFGMHSDSDVDKETLEKLLSGKFDINLFKYFNPKNRLDLK